MSILFFIIFIFLENISFPGRKRVVGVLIRVPYLTTLWLLGLISFFLDLRNSC